MSADSALTAVIPAERSESRKDDVHIPRDEHGPVFHAPWEAEAFALAVSLQARGLFTWKEWAATLERILTEKGVVESGVLARTRDAWQRACARTPHGTPIELRPADFRS